MSEAEAPEVGSSEHALVLQKIQPALLGLMDGSVSTLAPLFAAAELTHRPMAAFYVGLSASLGAGISMGLAEALSDDGVISGRGNPWTRGVKMRPWPIAGALAIINIAALVKMAGAAY